MNTVAEVDAIFADQTLSIREAAVKLNEVSLRNWKIQQTAQVLKNEQKFKDALMDMEATLAKIEASTFEDWSINTYPPYNGGNGGHSLSSCALIG